MSSKSTSNDVRAESGVVSVVMMVEQDLTAAAASVDAIRSLSADGPAIELVLAGAAGMESTLRDLATEAVTVTAGPGAGVAEGRNRGSEVARGEYLAFLAPGCRPDPAWLTSALAAFRRDARQALCASWILDGDTIVFAGSAMAVTGDPMSPDAGRSIRESSADDKSGFFPSSDGFVVDARAFAFTGGFDESLSAVVAAADLGWRMRLDGLGVVSCPGSRVQCAAASAASASEPTGANVETLQVLFKNLGEDSLAVLGVATLLTSRRQGGAEALAELDRALPALLSVRTEIQARRVVPDSEILPFFGDPEAVPGVPRSEVRELLISLGASRVFGRRRRVAVVTPDVLQPKMAGPAIRAWRMAIALSREHDVRLATTVECSLSHGSFPVTRVNDAGLRELEAWCDVLVFQGHVMYNHPWLKNSTKVVIVDIYDPIHLEVLEQSREATDWDRRHTARTTVEVLNQQLSRGDHFFCASEKQRDFWLGQLAALGRLNPVTYDDGENLEGLISVVPFGLDDEAPRRTRPAIRGVIPGIGPDDKVVIWGGGVYNWFDPLTLISAIDKLRRRVPEVRLFFMGMKHPNPNTPAMRMAYDTQQLAKELGLVGEHVFFNEDWVDYDDRQNYLLDADIGVSTHLDHVETAFSFRTRILDYLWASLPVVATSGDSFAELIELHQLGVVVPPGDVDALEAALFLLLTDDEAATRCRTNVAAFAPVYRWSRVLQPVMDVCAQARRAPDLVDPRQRVMIGDPIAQSMWGRRGAAYSLRVAVGHLKRREYHELTRKVRMRARVMLFPESAGPGTT